MDIDWKGLSENLRERSLAGMGQLPQYKQSLALEAKAKQEAETERRKSALMANRGALFALSQGRPEEALSALGSVRDFSPDEVDRVSALIQAGDQSALQELTYLDQKAVAMGELDPIGGSENKSQFAGSIDYVDEAGNQWIATRVADPRTGKTTAALAPVGHNSPQKGQLKRVNSLGLTAQQLPEQKAAEAGAAAQAAANVDLAMAPQTAAATANAVASVELKTMPQLRAAVANAEASAVSAVKAAEGRAGAESAYNVWETGMGSLVEAFDKTLTGPVVGWLPAMTTNQQIAVGAVAAVAPILKQTFRAAGEGVFTDRDQQLLLDMAPTRKDTPEAAAWKIQNIDKIVRAKMGMQGGQRSPSGNPIGDIPQVNSPPARVKFLGFD